MFVININVVDKTVDLVFDMVTKYIYMFTGRCMVCARASLVRHFVVINIQKDAVYQLVELFFLQVAASLT